MPIFDQGYQHWNGPLSGHGARWLVVTRHGVKALLKSWIVRLMLFVAWLPAIALVVFLVLWGLVEQQVASVVEFLRGTALGAFLDRPTDFRAAVWTIAYTVFFKVELYYSM